MLRILKGGVMIRKRVVISIILTLLAIWGSHNYWLQIKPIDVTFNLHGKNIKQAEVQLYKYSDENSKKFYSQSTKGKIKKQVKLSFKKPYAPKRLKLLITLNSLEGGGVCNLKLKDGKVKLNDLKNFSATGATLKVKDNKLLFSPTDKNVVISYNKKLNLHASTKFDLLVLLIIAIITYLFAYKITSYLADFKINKDKSRIDIVFLAIFFLILFIPMMRHSSEKTSTAENRKLAVYKPLFKKTGTLNWNYGKDFDNWYNDRFNFREKMVRLKTNIIYCLSTNSMVNNNIYLNKKNHWFTFLNHNKIATTLFADKDLDKYLHNLLILQNYCNKHNKQLYILFVPEKGIMYREEIFNNRTNISVSDRVKQLNDFITNNSNICVSYPYEALNEAKQTQLIFYKTDNHMTDNGNLILYNRFIQNYNKNNNLNIPYYTEQDFRVVKNKLRKRESNPYQFIKGTEYIAFNVDDTKLLDTTYSHYFAIRKNKKLINQTVFIFGDSHTKQLLQFFNNTFRKSTFHYTPALKKNQMKNFIKDNIKEIEKSNIIIVVYAGVACDNILKMNFKILNDL